MIACATCKTEKDEASFSPSSLRRPTKVCRACRSAYHARWYEQNRERHIVQTSPGNARRRRLTREVLLALKDRPCLDCGERFPPEAMDFDHVRGVKERVVSKLVAHSIERLLQEAEKCELVCANCHRLRTARRLVARGVKVRGLDERGPRG